MLLRVTVRRINNPRCIVLYYAIQMLTAPGWRRLERRRDWKPSNRRVQLPPYRYEFMMPRENFLETITS